jgi:NADPH:quinone reductase-like Zn-dependent oxidoreductase
MATQQQVPKTAFAYQFDRYGDADQALHGNENWTVPVPQAQEVLVQVKAAPINPSDLYYVKGLYPVKPSSFPAFAGAEGAGVVVAVGEGVDSALIGQRVHFIGAFNSWAEYAVTKVETLVPLADSTSFEIGAQLTVNPITALGMLAELGVSSGEFILQTAAASALGRLLIQVAKAKGVKTINIVRREEQKEELKAIGADFVINSETEDIVEKVQEITHGAGVKYAVDAVAGEVGTKVVQSLSFGGTVLIYGTLSFQPVQVEAPVAIFRAITVKGFWLVPWTQANPTKRDELYRELQELVAEGKITLPFKAFDLKTQLREAIHHSITPGKSEKTLLVP